MTSDLHTAPVVTATEVRVLEGPNLYFAKPAIKVSLDLTATSPPTRTSCAPWRAPRDSARSRPVPPTPSSGSGSSMRLAERAVRHVSRAARHQPAGRALRPGSERAVVVVAFVWRRRGRRGRSASRWRPSCRPGSRARDVVERGAATVPRRPRRPAASHRHAAHPRRVHHRHQRQDDDHPAARPHRHDRRAAHRVELHRRRRRPGRDDRARRLLRARRGPRRARGARRRARHPRDGPRRHAAQGHGRHPQRRQRRHQRLRRPPRPPGHRHRRPARRGQGDHHQGHPARWLGRPQRRRPPRLGHAHRLAGPALGLHPRRELPRHPRGARRGRPGHHRARRPGHRAHRLRRPRPARHASSTCR